MKLILAIIQDGYVNKIVKELMGKQIRATRLASTGGFLKSGSTTLLIGVKEEQLEEVIKVIEGNSKSTKVQEGDNELTVKGANLFIMDVDDHLSL